MNYYKKRICSYCKKEYLYNTKHTKSKYCNYECFIKSNKGKKAPCSFKNHKHTKETLQRMSKIQKELSKSEYKKNLIREIGHRNKGIKRSEEWKNEWSIKSKERGVIRNIPIRSGKKHWNWKGGITPLKVSLRKSSNYKHWRMSVFTRDNYTCQLCGEKNSVSGKLEADHFPILFSTLFNERNIEKMWDINNGRTLCKDCHKIITFGEKIV